VITVRPVSSEEDIDTYVAVRTRVHPENPMPREVVVDERTKPDHVDLIGEIDGVPVGVASTSKFGGAPDGEFAYLSIRVVAEQRRQGVGTALHLEASEHARGLRKSRFYVVVRDVDDDSLGYYSLRGYQEIGRMQDVELDLAAVSLEPAVPAGVEIVLLTADLELGAYQVALEADADIPSATTIESGAFDAWRSRSLGPLLSRELSFVALAGGQVIAYALIGRFNDDTYQHWMTGVARVARGRGIALALKQTQIAAAKLAGARFLRTQNDLGNASMRRVNEKLGYERKFEWAHLAGPLLGG
jgi:GNAT superfamily N-acetyltransferase